MPRAGRQRDRLKIQKIVVERFTRGGPTRADLLEPALKIFLESGTAQLGNG